MRVKGSCGFCLVAVAFLTWNTAAAQGADPLLIPCSEARKPSVSVETSEVGVVHFVVPAGGAPEIGPLELADRLREQRIFSRRAYGAVSEIVCMEYEPEAVAVPGSDRRAGLWRVHARGSFSTGGPLSSTSSCQYSEAVISIGDGYPTSAISFRGDSRCTGSGASRLEKGR